MKNVSHVTFDVVVSQSETPVLVDFWAPWCKPCNNLAPLLEELETEFSGVKFVKVNADENESLVVKYSVMGLPTLLIFKGGQVVSETTGFISKDMLRQFIQKGIEA